jgi:excisionase family DNA binding protein
VTEVAQEILGPSFPSEADAILAKETSRVLARRLRADEPLGLCISDDPSPEGAFNLPASALRLLVRILEEMACGNAVKLLQVHAELTTQEAADILNMSRPSLIQLLDEGKIEFRRVGTHRRVRFEAVMEYKRQADNERRKALQRLAAYDQEVGI